MKKKVRLVIPNYQRMFDGYVMVAQRAYNEYKNVLIESIRLSGIDNDGYFVFYDGNIYKVLEEKMESYKKAYKEMEEFRELHKEYLKTTEFKR